MAFIWCTNIIIR